MALNEQTEMAFGDQPPKIDPISGNEVPPGALPSEVRDDIPARLSEGEYVVPADVLQFFGIKFFEDLRTKAKTELAELEEGGRMGGESMPMEGQGELPFSLDELQTYDAEDDGMAANEGGMVLGFNEGGSTDSATPNFPVGASSVFTMPSTVFKTFVNEAGLRMYIRFVNGVPMSPIPTGYTEEGVAAETSAPVQTPVAREEGENRSQEAIDLENSPFVKPFEIMTKAELARFAAEISKTKIYNAITGVPGMIGFGAKAQEKRWSDYVSKVNDMGTKGQKDFVNGLQTNIDAGDRDANIAIAKVNNGGKDVTHLDIMTGDVGYLKKTRVSNIGISDADMLDDLAGGSSTSDDGTTPYIPIDYSDDVLSADFVGDDATSRRLDYYDSSPPMTNEPATGGTGKGDMREVGGDEGANASAIATLKEKIDREREETNRAVEKAVEQAKKDRKEEKETSANKAGGRFMNKGGLATRKKKK